MVLCFVQAGRYRSRFCNELGEFVSSGNIAHNPVRRLVEIEAWDCIMPALPQEITQLLMNWSQGDKAALDQLVPLVYPELRRLAKRHMDREDQAHTLQTSALINEAYLKLVDQQNVEWQNRAHFFAVAAQVMRHILVDHARTRNYAKRGGGAPKLPLDEAAALTEQRAGQFDSSRRRTPRPRGAR